MYSPCYFTATLCLDEDVVESVVFFFQAEGGIRDLVRSRGLGDVYKRQAQHAASELLPRTTAAAGEPLDFGAWLSAAIQAGNCLLYTSDAADERSSVDLGGRRIIKKRSSTES